MITRIRPKRSHWPAKVFDRAQELYNERPTPNPPQLAELLAADSELAAEWEARTPPRESTLREWIAKHFITLDPEDAPWSLADSKQAPEDARLILPVLRWADEHARPRPSRAVCEWIVVMRRIAGVDFDLESIYELAQHARRGGGDVERVEEYLSYEPWTEAGMDALVDAVNAGRTSFGVVFMQGGVEPRRKDGRDG